MMSLEGLLTEVPAPAPAPAPEQTVANQFDPLLASQAQPNMADGNAMQQQMQQMAMQHQMQMQQVSPRAYTKHIVL